MMKTKLWLLALAALLLGAVPSRAHHSFADEFDANRPVTLRGTLTKLEWVNPHGWIHLDVKGPTGTVVNWAVETGGVNVLFRRGLRATDFPSGVEVEIKGYRARNGKEIANGASVKFADGRDFFLGSSGTGAPTPPGVREQ